MPVYSCIMCILILIFLYYAIKNYFTVTNITGLGSDSLSFICCFICSVCLTLMCSMKLMQMFCQSQDDVIGWITCVCCTLCSVSIFYGGIKHVNNPGISILSLI